MSEDQAVIDRLRASKAQDDASDESEGAEMGRVWAREIATARELERLESLHDDLQAGEADYTFSDLCTMPRSHREQLRADHPALVIGRAIKPDDVTDAKSAVQFWDAVGLPDVYQQHGCLLLGFVEGALEVWHNVKAQL